MLEEVTPIEFEKIDSRFSSMD